MPQLKFSLFLLSLTLIWLTACASEPPKPIPTATPAMKVAEFATQVPVATQPITATITPTLIPLPTATQPPTTTMTSTLITTRTDDINPLTGLHVTDTMTLKRRPLIVRIGNDPAARPQTNLDKADVIYEELTEWAITRYSAIYLANTPDMIGPIRSARLSNVQLVPQYQAALAHSGGSDPVRWELSQLDIVDLDEFFHPTPYFLRPNEGWQTRLVVRGPEARAYMAEKGWEKAVKLRGFVFSDKLDVTFPSAKTVIIPYPPTTSEAKWTYNPKSQAYLRWTTDEILTNHEGQQISATNVIIYFADHQATDIKEDSTGATSIRIILNGQGKAWVMREGQIMKGNWSTNGEETPMFTFDNGAPMLLKPGNSWIEVVPLTYEITIDGQTQ